jgi:predicted nucleotidyltransferase
MISNEDKIKLSEIARSYIVAKLYLFGSNLESAKDANDFDLAVEGISDKVFFKLYGEIIFSLSNRSI